MYRQNLYKGFISYDGNKLYMDVFLFENESVMFTVDENLCSVTFSELLKTYKTDDVPSSFLPVIIYKFFYRNGAVIRTELYDNEDKKYSFKSSVESDSVVLDVSVSEEGNSYLLTVS